MSNDEAIGDALEGNVLLPGKGLKLNVWGDEQHHPIGRDAD